LITIYHNYNSRSGQYYIRIKLDLCIFV
jgi:hypothetical protein